MPQGKGTYGSKVGRPKKRVTYKKGKKVSKKKALTDRQKETLKKHSIHHTAKHMAMMRRLMREGSTFTSAHKKAMKKVGK